MKLLKVGAAALNQIPLDWDHNKKNIVASIEEAREQNVDVLLLPEMCITGYGCEDMFLSPHVSERALEVLKEIVPRTHGMVVSVGLPVTHRNALYNASAFIASGRVSGYVCKKYLAGDGVHYEPRWFKAWPADVREWRRGAEFSIDGRPIGDLMFSVNGIIFGYENCEEAWVSKRTGGELSMRGCDIILNPSASHFAFGKAPIRRRLVIEGARAFGVTYMYANLLGNEAGRVIYDGDPMIASAGHFAATRSFSFKDRQLVTAVVDIEQTRRSRIALVSHIPVVGEPSHSIESADRIYQWSSKERHPEVWNDTSYPWSSEVPPTHYAAMVKEHEFVHAVALGLFDYLRKSKAQGFTISLSGGCDSSTAAILVEAMVSLAISELGWEGFKERLGHIKGIQNARSQKEVMNKLLLCVYQPSHNSSEITQKAAKELATAIGARFEVLNVGDITKLYEMRAWDIMGRVLSWAEDDIALQNIQARARGPGIWLLANLTGTILLTTSNRSESAVGYATMDGDTCGGLAPIAGVDKQFLCGFLRKMESIGLSPTIIPIPALRYVNQQIPTAELRPLTEAQSDENDLMPYAVLQAIEYAAIVEKRKPVDILQILEATMGLWRYDVADLGKWIEKFFTLWCRNQWKRERYAPSFHLDDESLDPKTACRFPILSGGFVKEIEEMHDYINKRLENARRSVEAEELIGSEGSTGRNDSEVDRGGESPRCESDAGTPQEQGGFTGDVGTKDEKGAIDGSRRSAPSLGEKR